MTPRVVGNRVKQLVRVLEIDIQTVFDRFGHVERADDPPVMSVLAKPGKPSLLPHKMSEPWTLRRMEDARIVHMERNDFGETRDPFVPLAPLWAFVEITWSTVDEGGGRP